MSFSEPLVLRVCNGWRVYIWGWALPLQFDDDVPVRPPAECYHLVFNRTILSKYGEDFNIVLPHIINQAIADITNKWSASMKPFIIPAINVTLFMGNDDRTPPLLQLKGTESYMIDEMQMITVKEMASAYQGTSDFLSDTLKNGLHLCLEFSKKAKTDEDQSAAVCNELIRTDTPSTPEKL